MRATLSALARGSLGRTDRSNGRQLSQLGKVEESDRRPLANSNPNKTLKIGAQVFDAAIEHGLVSNEPLPRQTKACEGAETPSDVARALGSPGDSRRGGEQATLLATMILGGLRVLT
jgi:hypothetical protein